MICKILKGLLMLEKDFLYYARVRYNSANGSQSPWSSSFSFKANAIDTPSFLVPNDVTTSNPYFTVGLSPFFGGSLTKAGGVIEAHATPDFDSLLSQSFIGANSDYVEIHIGETNLASYYIRFKYTTTNGAESSWSAGKRITYSSVPEGMTINNLNLKISQFTLIDGGQVDFTVVGSQSFLLQSVSSVVIKPGGNAGIFNFTPSSGNTTSFTGSGNIGYLSNGSYELRVNVKCKDLVTNEIHTFPLKRSEIYPPLSVNNPTVTSSKTSIAQQGEAAYPSGLPPYIAPTGSPSYPSGLPAYIAPTGNASYPQGLPMYSRTFTRTYGTTNFSLYTTQGAVFKGSWTQSGGVNDPGVGLVRRADIITDDAEIYDDGWKIDPSGSIARGQNTGLPIYRASGNGWTYNSSADTHVCAAAVTIIFSSTYITANDLFFNVDVPWGTLTQSGLEQYPSGLPPYDAGQGNPSYPSGLPPYNAGQGNSSYPSGLPAYIAPYKYFNLTSSAFSGNWSQTHSSTEWQISTNNSFPNFFQSTTVSSGNKLVLRTNNMNSATTYYVRCRYRSDSGVYSSWSPTITLS